jgi:hypothetical protein
VLDIDRLGDGQSSHPPSTDLTFANTIYALHEVIQALRPEHSELPSHEPYTSVTRSVRRMALTRSPATLTSTRQSSPHTGTDSPSFVTLGNENSYPAIDDPVFAESELDTAYLTTIPGHEPRFTTTREALILR